MRVTKDVPGMSYNSASHPDTRNGSTGSLQTRQEKKKPAILSFHRSKGPRIDRFRGRKQKRGYWRLQKARKGGLLFS